MSQLRTLRELTRSDKRAITVLKEGMKKWENLRFITLTGVNGAKGSFRKLKDFLNRKMGKIQYFGVRTGEGNGVIHLVYAGKSVRYAELKTQWEKISGSWVVSISRVRNIDGMIKEMTRQFRKIRYFRSKHWTGLPSYQSSLNGRVLDEYYSERDMRFHS